MTGPYGPEGRGRDHPNPRVRRLFFDVETTGKGDAPPGSVHRIVSFAMVEGRKRRLSFLVNPERLVGESFAIHGLSDEELAKHPRFRRFIPRILRFLQGTDSDVPVQLWAHNIPFDVSHLNQELMRAGRDPVWGLVRGGVLDSLELARRITKAHPELFGDLRSHELGELVKHPAIRPHIVAAGLDVDDAKLHGALHDTRLTQALVGAYRRIDPELVRSYEAEGAARMVHYAPVTDPAEAQKISEPILRRHGDYLDARATDWERRVVGEVRYLHKETRKLGFRVDKLLRFPPPPVHGPRPRPSSGSVIWSLPLQHIFDPTRAAPAGAFTSTDPRYALPRHMFEALSELYDPKRPDDTSFVVRKIAVPKRVAARWTHEEIIHGRRVQRPYDLPFAFQVFAQNKRLGTRALVGYLPYQGRADLGETIHSILGATEHIAVGQELPLELKDLKAVDWRVPGEQKLSGTAVLKAPVYVGDEGKTLRLIDRSLTPYGRWRKRQRPSWEALKELGAGKLALALGGIVLLNRLGAWAAAPDDPQPAQALLPYPMMPGTPQQLQAQTAMGMMQAGMAVDFDPLQPWKNGTAAAPMPSMEPLMAVYGGQYAGISDPRLKYAHLGNVSPGMKQPRDHPVASRMGVM